MKTQKPRLMLQQFAVPFITVTLVYATTAPAAADTTCNKDGCDLIAKYINPTITLLTIVFCLVAVISLILGSIQYITSEGDPQKSSKAKNRIAGTVLAIFAYALLYGFLQFIIPGGAFNRK